MTAVQTLPMPWKNFVQRGVGLRAGRDAAEEQLDQEDRGGEAEQALLERRQVQRTTPRSGVTKSGTGVGTSLPGEKRPSAISRASRERQAGRDGAHASARHHGRDLAGQVGELGADALQVGEQDDARCGGPAAGRARCSLAAGRRCARPRARRPARSGRSPGRSPIGLPSRVFWRVSMRDTRPGSSSTPPCRAMAKRATSSARRAQAAARASCCSCPPAPSCAARPPAFFT